jgi:phosphoglycerate dehydrogenase-like enzyme
MERLSDRSEKIPNVACLRPEADFMRVGVTPPNNLAITYSTPDDAGLAALISRSHGLVIPAVGPKLDPELFRDSQLRLVQVTGAGTDRLDLGTLQRLNIAVANVPGGSNDAVAEYVVATALILLRRLRWASSELRNARYKACRASLLADNLPGLRDLLIGVVGFGTIGSAVASAFVRMGSRICYCDPAAESKTDARSVSLDELLRTADVVTLHVPLLPSTRNLISFDELAKMKPGAILVDASRGGVVDQAALANRLRAGLLGGAAVDVYSEEPPADDHPLLALDGEGAARLLLTPHIAGVTRQASTYLFRTAWENIERVLVRGEEPRHRVN